MIITQPSPLVKDQKGTMEGIEQKKQMFGEGDLFEEQISWIKGTMIVSF